MSQELRMIEYKPRTMKNIILTYVASMLTLLASAQVKYEVTCKDLPGDLQTLYLYNMETREQLDSASVKKGEATLSGTLNETSLMALCLGQNLRRDIYICFIADGTPVELQGNDIQAASELNLRFGHYQSEATEFGTKQNQFMDEYRTLYKQTQGKIPAEKMAEFEDRYEKMQAEISTWRSHILADNKDNLIPLTYLLTDADGIGYEHVAEYLKEYKYADRPSLTPIKSVLEKEACKMPGAKVVDFEMKDLKGDTVRLTDWVGKGNYVLVDFWASWCGPCRQEMPNVKADYEKYHPKGFEVVGVSLDRSQQAWEQGVRDLGIRWPQMSDLKYWQSEAAALYNIRAIPATILFAPDGTVVKANLRGAELSNKLKEIYGE